MGEQRKAAREYFQDSKPFSRKAVGSLLYVFNAAEKALLLGHRLDLYPKKWLCATKLLDLHCLSSLFLACVYSTAKGFFALDALDFHTLSAAQDIVDSFPFSFSVLQISLMTL